MKPLRAALTAALVAGLALPGAAAADGTESSPNMQRLTTLGYDVRNGVTPNYGTDIEFGTVRGKRHAFAGSYRNGLQIFDISKPASPRRAGVYDCGVTQGDVQVFRQADEPGRVFVTYTSDTFGDGTSTCYREAAALGFDVRKANGSGKNGTFIVDVTDPAAPRTVSFAEVPKGSHNQTVHPSGNFMYNSNSDLITSALGTTDAQKPGIEVFDISDPAAPKQITKVFLPVRPGLGTESHDITFNAKGDRAYSAALSQGVILDTTDPAKPSIVTSFLDPTINVWHQSDPFSVRQADGSRRDFLIVEDEFVGAVGTGQCPNGGVHVFEITGELERNPRKVGFWNIDDIRPTDSVTDSCTAHVFDIHEDAKVMTIAYYNGGVRVVDLSGLAGVGVGGTALTGQPMKEIGFYRQEGADSWSAKTPKIHPVTGDFHLFGNDINRGLDVYKFDGDGKPSKNRGRWMTADEHRASATPVDVTRWPGPLDLMLEGDEHEQGGHAGHSH